jgi:serine/threonine protein kinase
MKNILLGIKYMHSLDISHRDLKPENILIRDLNDLTNIVICDFGMSMQIKGKYFLNKRCGTPGYIAPEIINTKVKSI